MIFASYLDGNKDNNWYFIKFFDSFIMSEMAERKSLNVSFQFLAAAVMTNEGTTRLRND
jgi:hypothetical protein